MRLPNQPMQSRRIWPRPLVRVQSARNHLIPNPWHPPWEGLVLASAAVGTSVAISALPSIHPEQGLTAIDQDAVEALRRVRPAEAEAEEARPRPEEAKGVVVCVACGRPGGVLHQIVLPDGQPLRVEPHGCRTGANAPDVLASPAFPPRSPPGYLPKPRRLQATRSS